MGPSPVMVRVLVSLSQWRRNPSPVPFWPARRTKDGMPFARGSPLAVTVVPEPLGHASWSSIAALRITGPASASTTILALRASEIESCTYSVIVSSFLERKGYPSAYSGQCQCKGALAIAALRALVPRSVTSLDGRLTTWRINLLPPQPRSA